jgi:TolB-like protein
VFASKAFAGSKRSQDFLQLIVEHALAGRVDNLRERMIGAELFGRSIDYDTANDGVVRVKASEVRRKMAQYYRDLPQPPVLRIELRPGSYAPIFHWASAAKTEAIPAEPEQAEPREKQRCLPAAWETLHRRRLMAGALAGLALFAVTTYFVFKLWPQGNSGFQSIAVLPIENLSGDPRQDYFADSLTDELIADLGQVSALRVISRTSAMTYKGTKKTLPEIARELGVNAVVEGSVLGRGNQVRITAQLIDAKTDDRLWSCSYVRDLDDVLTLQAEVARGIADQIRIEVTPEERARLAGSRTVDPDAQELYLQGMQKPTRDIHDR